METGHLSYRCPHCANLVEVSEGVMGETVHCPNVDCGKPFRAEVPSAMPSPNAVQTPEGAGPTAEVHEPAGNEEVLREVHPAMLRSHPLRYLLMGLLLVAGVAGLVISLFGDGGLQINNTQLLGPSGLALASVFVTGLAVLLLFTWWLQIMTTTLTVTNERTRLRQGIISRRTTEVRHRDVRNLQIEQSVMQRIFGVGDVAISSSGQDTLEIVVHSIPRPHAIAKLVRDRQ